MGLRSHAGEKRYGVDDLGKYFSKAQGEMTFSCVSSSGYDLRKRFCFSHRLEVRGAKSFWGPSQAPHQEAMGVFSLALSANQVFVYLH